MADWSSFQEEVAHRFLRLEYQPTIDSLPEIIVKEFKLKEDPKRAHQWISGLKMAWSESDAKYKQLVKDLEEAAHQIKRERRLRKEVEEKMRSEIEKRAMELAEKEIEEMAKKAKRPKKIVVPEKLPEFVPQMGVSGLGDVGSKKCNPYLTIGIFVGLGWLVLSCLKE